MGTVRSHSWPRFHRTRPHPVLRRALRKRISISCWHSPTAGELFGTATAVWSWFFPVGASGELNESFNAIARKRPHNQPLHLTGGNQTAVAVPNNSPAV